MVQAMFEGFTYLLDLHVIGLVLLAVALAQIVAVIPGLGGAFLLVLMLPFAVVMDPVPGIALLIAAMVASGTGNTVTSVFFGVPGSGAGVAVIFDGYPLAKQGQARRALSAGLTASAVGGVIGAFVLALALPIVRPVVLLLGPPEIFVMILIAVFFIGYIAEAPLARSLVSAGIGMLFGLVGQEPSTATLRYTGDFLYLWDGVKLVPFMLGLFAVSEMMDLMRKGNSFSAKDMSDESGGTKQGMMDVFRHWEATLRSSIIGVGVGIIPGLGAAAAQFMGYGHVAKAMRGRTEVEFGKGAIEGVIAADAPTNSKEGGTLIPTLAFGIPGSSSMAILLGAFLMLGIQPGRAMLEGDGLAVTWMIIWILVMANLVAAGLVLALSGPLSRLAYTRNTILVPVILCVSLFGAYVTTLNIGDVIVAMLIGFIGYYMKIHDYSRAAMIIGFVLAPLGERNLILSYNIHGWGFVTRPIVLALVGVFLFSFISPKLYRLIRGGERKSIRTELTDPEAVASSSEDRPRPGARKDLR